MPAECCRVPGAVDATFELAEGLHCMAQGASKRLQQRGLYDQYSFQVIPAMGHLVAGQWKPYQYLVESIRQFPAQEEFKEMIEAAGFRCVTYENLNFGVVAIHSGFKL